MESLSLKEENIIKYIRNLVRLKKKQNYTKLKSDSHLPKTFFIFTSIIALQK